MPFWQLCCESETILLKKIRPGPGVPVTGMECSYGEFFSLVVETLFFPTEIPATEPASHMNSPKVLQRK